MSDNLTRFQNRFSEMYEVVRTVEAIIAHPEEEPPVEEVFRIEVMRGLFGPEEHFTARCWIKTGVVLTEEDEPVEALPGRPPLGLISDLDTIWTEYPIDQTSRPTADAALQAALEFLASEEELAG
ncbi:MAG TPA: hypothetical protein VKT32_03695 [Chthonomonadaceae bacterium]|nr:hypothetical protein [Chthonomonadaceae bacterium]